MWEKQVIVVVLIILISSFYYPLISDNSLDDFENVENIIEPQLDEIDDDEVSSTRSASSHMISSQNDAFGGSWVDSFEDDSGIDWALSDTTLNISDGEAKLGSRNIANSDFESGTIGSVPNDWVKEESTSGSGTFDHDLKLVNDRYFEGKKSVFIYSKVTSLGMPATLKTSTTNISTNGFVNVKGSSYVNVYLSNMTVVKSHPSWGWNCYVHLVFDDGTTEYSERLFWEGQGSGGYVYSDNTQSSGADGSTWYKFKVAIPESMDKSHLKIKVRFEAGNWYHINDYSASISGNVDRISVDLTSTNFTTKPISLPEGKRWDTLLISSYQPLDSYINITIINPSTNLPIPGSPIYGAAFEYDISTVIDSKKYPTIKLNGFLLTKTEETPTLFYWAVSWIKNNTWYDTLYGGLKVGSQSNVEVVDGEVRFSNGGTFISNAINLPDEWYYNTLQLNRSTPLDGFLNITILDEATDNPIAGYEDLGDKTIDLTGLNPHLYPSIKLKAIYKTTGAETAKMFDWMVNWIGNTYPSIVDISPSPRVSTERTRIIKVNLTDNEDAESDLTIIVEYKAPSDIDWKTGYMAPPVFKIDHWDCAFSPIGTAELGTYTFKFTCKDSFQYTYIYPDPYTIEVYQKQMPPPDVSITPVKPTTQNDLNAAVTNENEIGTALEGNPFEFWYRWYKNDKYLSEYDNVTIIPKDVTTRDDKWSCRVNYYDYEDFSPTGSAKVTIENAPPVQIEDFSSVEMNEDTTIYIEDKLISIFMDPDGDTFTYSSSGEQNVNINIFQNNGTIEFKPVSNWYGTETITFYTNDSFDQTGIDVLVTVKPTNDLPRIVQVGDTQISEGDIDVEFPINQDESLELIVAAEDIDGDTERSNFEYSSDINDSEDFYFDESTHKIVFNTKNSDVGSHYVNLMVTDNNETPVQYVSQRIKINVINVNDLPSVTIITPESGQTFSENDNIVLNCSVQDIDLLVKNPTEKIKYRWYVSYPETKELGNSQVLSNINLEPGEYVITIEVEDSGKEKAFDTVEITVKESESKAGFKESIAGSWILWLLIIILIVIFAIVYFVVMKRKKKSKEEAKPEGALAPGAKPGIGPTPTTPFAPGAKPIPQLPPPGSPEALAEAKAKSELKQKLENLDGQLSRGEIDPITYQNLKIKYETEASRVKVKPAPKPAPVPQLPPAKQPTPQPTPTPTPTPTPKTSGPPGQVQPKPAVTAAPKAQVQGTPATAPTPAPAPVPKPTPQPQPQAQPQAEAQKQPEVKKGPAVTLPGQNKK
ncbi:MAG: cadherin-like domain-containing protein [Thermoplasmata archaeon]|nr:MAG: cadherin-like domain-containing protein [Thermoplasmata archaeon]